MDISYRLKEYLRFLKGCAIMNRKLTQVEIDVALKDFPPVLTPEEAASLLRIKLSTLYRHVSEGRYGASVKRGKPLRFWRDRLAQEFML
jgi:excisionase family DNA binding protein